MTDFKGSPFWICTATGRSFSFTAPSIDDITILDIAESLSKTCRWNGHTKGFYSVAEHSILISRIAERTLGPELALAGLMHDAAEAYMGDIVSPMKWLLESKGITLFSDLETEINNAIAAKFNIQDFYPASIKDIDMRMLVTEAAYLLTPCRTPWVSQLPFEKYSPSDATISCMNHEKAKELFLRRFFQLAKDGYGC